MRTRTEHRSSRVNENFRIVLEAVEKDPRPLDVLEFDLNLKYAGPGCTLM